MAALAAALDVGLITLTRRTPSGGGRLPTLHCASAGLALRIQVAVAGQGVRRLSLVIKADEV